MKHSTKSFTHFKAAVFFLLFFSLGLSVTYTQIDFSSAVNNREIASLPQSSQAWLNPDTLRDSIAQNIYISTTPEEKILSLYGSAQALCLKFDSAKITLKAEGLLINGEAPTVTVDSPCYTDNQDYSSSLKWKKSTFNQAAFSDVSIWKIEQIEFRSDLTRKVVSFNNANSRPLYIENQNNVN